MDAQVLSPEGSLYDVIFVGTSTGANLVGTGNMAKNNGRYAFKALEGERPYE